jgi:hypothetical protein
MPLSSKNLAFPKVIDPADPPIRPERHVPSSISLSAWPSPVQSLASPKDARVANERHTVSSYDTVRLASKNEDFGIATDRSASFIMPDQPGSWRRSSFAT